MVNLRNLRAIVAIVPAACLILVQEFCEAIPLVASFSEDVF